jgi:sugar lactone lactonase YvrE
VGGHGVRWLRTGLRAAVVAGLAVKLAAGSILPAYAASGTLFGVNVTGPAGGALVDSHFWVSDHAGAFCRMDLNQPPAPSGVYGEALCYIGALPGAQDKPNQMGQPSWDTSRNLVYVPDYKSNSLGVWRFTYSSSTQSMVGNPTLIAPNQGLGGLRPDATALGPDGNLYVGSLNTGDIKRVTNPAGDSSTQTVQTIGKSMFGKRVFGLAFVGNDLYLAETNGLTVIRNATSLSCTGGCQAVRVAGTPNVETDAIVASGSDTIYYAQSNSVYRFTISTGDVVVYANAGTLTPDQVALVAQNQNASFTWGMNCSGATCPFAFPPGEPSGLSLDAQGNLYVGDDPGLAAGLAGGPHGRIWEIPAGSAPIG